MSSQKNKRNYFIQFGLLVYVASVLSACSGNATLEGKLAPDPALKNNSGNIVSPTPTPSNSTPTPTQDNFPPEIPRYPQAKLLDTKPGASNQQIITRWSSSDPVNLIQNYYEQQFQTNQWEIVQDFGSNSDSNTLIARLNELEVKLTVIPSSSNTEFTIEYQADNIVNQTPTPSPTISTVQTPLSFSDLAQVPQSLVSYVEDLAKLGVLTSNIPSEQFNPNAPITRRDYARWLFNANNRIFANSPGKQIRPAADSTQPIFQDIKAKDPDFAVIQGLAEAGLIPSSLTGDSNDLNFRPDAPLTREDLVKWKVPIDTRKALRALPPATIDTIKDTWGFQDSAKLEPNTLRSLYADYQNGEQSNIRRAFGYTTIFQAKKPVTRAEAAAALWYFGYQGDGISAQEAPQMGSN